MSCSSGSPPGPETVPRMRGRRRLLAQEGFTLPLRAMEAKLLAFFKEHPDECLPQEIILEQVWEIAGATPNVLKVTVHNLRKNSSAPTNAAGLKQSSGTAINGSRPRERDTIPSCQTAKYNGSNGQEIARFFTLDSTPKNSRLL